MIGHGKWRFLQEITFFALIQNIVTCHYTRVNGTFKFQSKESLCVDIWPSDEKSVGKLYLNAARHFHVFTYSLDIIWGHRLYSLVRKQLEMLGPPLLKWPGLSLSLLQIQLPLYPRNSLHMLCLEDFTVSMYIKNCSTISVNCNAYGQSVTANVEFGANGPPEMHPSMWWILKPFCPHLTKCMPIFHKCGTTCMIFIKFLPANVTYKWKG